MHSRPTFKEAAISLIAAVSVFLIANAINGTL